MLQKTRRTEVRDAVALSPEDDRALRDAFGRFADADARVHGSRVVKKYQHLEFGHWFLCDCLGKVDRPPALVPVDETYIRRHYEHPWPLHHPDCDFFSEPGEQREVTRSFQRPAAVGTVSLLSRDAQTGRPPQVLPSGRDFSAARSKLATLLMTLIENAGLNTLSSDGIGRLVRIQYAALRAAAGGIHIDRGVALSHYLCTFLPALPDLVEKISTAEPGSFHTSRRPHGVVLAVFREASGGKLHSFHDTSFPVRGTISVFGETDGHQAVDKVGGRARSPYLGICLVGRASPESPVEILKAYLHPCLSTSNLMPVDSDLERQTFDKLMSLQSWLRRIKSVMISIEKPLFDVTPAVAGHANENGSAPTVAATEPCIPDFILRQEGSVARGSPVVVVETMGYLDEVYRDRKRRTHAAMITNLGNAPVVIHDFHFPRALQQADRDNRFWKDCRWTITGPDV